MKESERISRELKNLGPEFAETGIVKTVLRRRMQQELRREMETKITRKQLTTVVEALTELIDNWNDDAMDDDRGRDNNALCLLIWDDGSGQLGTQWGDVFNKQMEFDSPEELADALAPWLDFAEEGEAK